MPSSVEVASTTRSRPRLRTHWWWMDTTCPPTSVYAAFNALTIPKKIHIDTLAGHTNTPKATKFMQEAALAHVREMKSAK